MDLKSYYQRIRALEESMAEDFVVVKSLATESGGQAGRLSEASRTTAARMIVDGVAEPASVEEAEAFRSAAAEARRKELERRRAAEVQFTVISDSDLRALTGSRRSRGKE